MSLLGWLSRKTSVAANSALPSEPGESTRPSQLAQSQAAQGHRKGERHVRRQLLYRVIRDCMVQAGVLSSSYRFKVLSLDSRGRQFLVMVDLAGPPEATAELARIEAAIAQAAKARHGIVVKAVYWRQHHPAVARAAQQAASATGAASVTSAARLPGADETVAFDEAQAEGSARANARAFDGTPVQGPQSYTLLTGYEDTEQSPNRHQPGLSSTQYGDLR